MRNERVTFTNPSGQRLAGRLDLPADGRPLAYAVFSHCFTCGKNLHSAGRIAEAVTAAGIAVLRFDFAGIGESEGEFAQTTFSTNVEDLVSAADHLAERYDAPRLFIGHSMGGAVAMRASQLVDSVDAVAVIGTPASPGHVRRHLGQEAADVMEQGEATIMLAGRPFTFRRAFLDDVEAASLEASVVGVRQSLLILHSPTDATVGIENAAQLFTAARHPKSFVSLAGADHLLSNDGDAAYVGNVIATWSARYLGLDQSGAKSPDMSEPDPESVVTVRTDAGFRSDVMANGFPLVADEPIEVGGTNLGPTPYDYLLVALGACTSMTLRMYADRKAWPLQSVTTQLRHTKVHARDCAHVESDTGMVDHIDRTITIEGELDAAQRARLLEIADRCPVHRTLHGEIVVDTVLAPAS